MEDREQELVKKLMGNLFTKYYTSGKVFILTHFMAMGVPKLTVCRLWYEEGMDNKKTVGS